MQSAFVVFLAVVLQMHASHGEVQVTQQGCVFQLPSVLCRVLSALSCLQGWSSFGLLPEQERGSDTLHSQAGRGCCAACGSLVLRVLPCGETCGTGGSVDVRIVKSELLLSLGCLCRRWIFSKLLWAVHTIFAKQILF